MAAYLVTIKRIQSGTQHSTGMPDAVTTEAQVNAYVAKNPDCMSVAMNIASEAQVRGLLHYAKAIDNAVDTSSVETAISAII